MEDEVQGQVAEVEEGGRQSPDLAPLEDEAGVVVEGEGGDQIQSAGGGGEDAEGDVGAGDDRELRREEEVKRGRSRSGEEGKKVSLFDCLFVVIVLRSHLSLSRSIFSPACTSPRTTVA